MDKKVKVLSGGERNRLALCMMLLKPINVLLMDEPTNHLDIQSKNVLKEALKNYEGTLILVSHDRDFLQGLTEKVYEFKNKNIKEYLGDINYFLEQRNASDMREFEQIDGGVPKEKSSDATREKKSLSYEEQKKLKTLNNRLSKIESQITELEKKIAKADGELADKYEQLMNDTVWFSNYEKLKLELDQAMISWEETQEAIESSGLK